MQVSYSFIIPVYNRPDEIQELLESFLKVDGNSEFEIIIIEDGSSISSQSIVDGFKSQLNISYLFKSNSGPGDSRNFGMQHAAGNYFIILDSDCLLPPHYFVTVKKYLSTTFVDCFGGADAAHPSFTSLQKAINYTMTSFLTTGGIRGKSKSIQKFEPRSFNMGISKNAFDITGGFSKIHPGEDPDLSQRILKAGFETAFIPDAFVFHKRRISWKKFYTQVKKFGLVRPILNTWHPDSQKITFWLPTLFVVFVFLSITLALFVNYLCLIPLLIYVILILLDSSIKNKNGYVGILSVIAVFVQFFGYGMAFLKSSFYLKVLKKNPKQQFPQLFFD
ncbi:MAG: glycosyltransferase [Flavobacteriaceae bacterium]